MVDKIQFSNIKVPSITKEKLDNGKEYVDYGDNNLFPQELSFFSNKSTTHAACLELIKLSIAGKGYTATPEAEAFLKSLDFETSNSSLLEKISMSMALYNGFALEVIWNVKGDKIVECYMLPFENIRVGHPDRYGNSNCYYYSCNWENTNEYETIPGFNPKFSKKFPKQLLYIAKPSNQSLVYPTPNYVTAINYIATEYELSKHYLTAAGNSFLPSCMITFMGIPTDEERRKYKKNFESMFVGSESVDKILFTYVDSPEKKPIIDVLQPNNAVDHFMNTSIECKNNIITGNGITSPALVAISDSNQSIFSNGDELKAAWDNFYKVKIQSYHSLIERSMNLVLKYAGFPDAGYNITPFTPYTIEEAPASESEAPTTEQKPVAPTQNYYKQ